MNTIKIALLGIFTLIGVTGMSQKQNRDINHRLAKADSILIVKLELTDAEQSAFLPLYHQFVKDKKENRKKHLPSERKAKKRMDELSDQELEEVIQKRFEFKQADLTLQKNYHEKFKKVLPMKKLAKFYHMEKRLFKRKKSEHKRTDKNPHR